ncbi:DUF1643 domain-containing protein [Oscillospiraceae bacterium PP1C4]
MLTVKSTMKTEVIYSDDKLHRLLVKRVWNPELPSACIIMLSPSSIADETSLDMTSMYVINNCHKLGFGSVHIMNLYSKMDSASHENILENDGLIQKVCKDCSSVILAYGTGCQTKQVLSRINTILDLLRPFQDKLFEISDGKGSGYHPLGKTVRLKWELVPFYLEKELKKA